MSGFHTSLNPEIDADLEHPRAVGQDLALAENPAFLPELRAFHPYHVPGHGEHVVLVPDVIEMDYPPRLQASDGCSKELPAFMRQWHDYPATLAVQLPAFCFRVPENRLDHVSQPVEPDVLLHIPDCIRIDFHCNIKKLY